MTDRSPLLRMGDRLLLKITIAQMKAIDRLLRDRGKTIADLPDSFAPVL